MKSCLMLPLLCAFALPTFTAGAAEPLPKVIRIGTIIAATGPYANETGNGIAAAARIAIEEFGGKVLGRPIELLVSDNDYKPDRSSSFAREWIEREGAVMIVDGTGSGPGLASAAVAKTFNRVFASTASSSPLFINEQCSPVSFVFGEDGYAHARAMVKPLVEQGGNSWFFITANTVGGDSMEGSLARFLDPNGAKSVGSVRNPLGTLDFSSFLIQAKSSGAKVIAAANAGGDIINIIKQAAEFRIAQDGSQRLVAYQITGYDVDSLGLQTSQGLVTSINYYWDANAGTREFSKRFEAREKVPPSITHAATYSAVMHFLKAVRDTGTVDGAVVAAKMKKTPVNDLWAKNIKVREDGRVLHDFYLLQVKKPEESKARWDYFKVLAKVPGDDAYQPLAESKCPLVKKS
ncbi:MAG TPA: ABC transporter substrate-binding protein [Burkholderiales bacterium]|nr:ABC transporter substrate-binding protein [Burkholderiales bacterium]